MNRLVPFFRPALTNLNRYAFYIPPQQSETHHHVTLSFTQPGLTAKRIIKCIHKRLNAFDPERWNVKMK